MSQEITEFMNNIKNVSGNRTHKVVNSYGVKDYLMHYRQNRPKAVEYKLTDSQYYAILREMNTALGDHIEKNGYVELPYRFGEIEFRKYKQDPKIIDGKLVLKSPVDWQSTLELWFEDEESRENKKLVRFIKDWFFRISYKRNIAVFPNQPYMEFTLVRELKKRIYSAADNGLIDGFIY